MPKSNSDHQFLVTVSGCSAEEAATVMNERISPDEDYGFHYEISHRDHTCPAIGMCKCKAGDMTLTHADGRVTEYIKAPADYKHGDEISIKVKGEAPYRVCLQNAVEPIVEFTCSSRQQAIDICNTYAATATPFNPQVFDLYVNHPRSGWLKTYTA